MNRIFYTISLKLIVITCLITVNNSFAQSSMRPKSMSVMNNKIMQPYEEVVKRKPATKFGFGAETYISGNAHGAFYSVSMNLLRKNSIFSLAPCLQNRSLEVNGVRLGYSVLLSGGKDRYDEDEIKEMEKPNKPEILELRLRCYSQYTHNGRLSNNASRVETITNPETGINYCEMRLSTIELAICPELLVNVKNVKLRAYAGFTTFYHFKYVDQQMYRPKFSPALVFGVGVLVPCF
jgi:hypothetical protein